MRGENFVKREFAGVVFSELNIEKANTLRLGKPLVVLRLDELGMYEIR